MMLHDTDDLVLSFYDIFLIYRLFIFYIFSFYVQVNYEQNDVTRYHAGVKICGIKCQIGGMDVCCTTHFSGSYTDLKKQSFLVTFVLKP